MTLDRRRFLALAGGALLAGACSGGDGDDAGTAAPSTNVERGSTAATVSSSSAETMPDTPAEPPTASAPTSAPIALTPADFDRAATCVLLPAMAAGPFPLDEQFVRRDITEGHPGHPVRLGLRVVDAACAAVAGAAVEVWHCDATGDYSAFSDGGGGKDEAEGTTFLRGTQIAGDDGIVEFTTIYPGWYPGRAVHIHLRVRVGDELLLTSQLFFDDIHTAAVLATGPYAEFGLPDTPNGDDRIAGDVASNGTLLDASAAPTPLGDGTIALANLAIAV